MARIPKFRGDLNYYSLLHLKQDATEDEIKKAFRDLSFLYHPDRLAGQSEEMKKNAGELFKDINEAYQVLRDPEMRKLYDQTIAKQFVSDNGANKENAQASDEFRRRTRNQYGDSRIISYENNRVVFPQSVWINLEKRIRWEEKIPVPIKNGEAISLFAQEHDKDFHIFAGIYLDRQDMKDHNRATRKILLYHPEIVLIPCAVREEGVLQRDIESLIQMYKGDETKRYLNHVFIIGSSIALYRIHPSENFKVLKADLRHPGTMLFLNFSKEVDEWVKKSSQQIKTEYKEYFKGAA